MIRRPRREVSCRSLAWLIAAAQAKGLAVESIARDAGYSLAHLSDNSRWMSWSGFVSFSDAIALHFSEEEMVAEGERIFSRPSFRFMGLIARPLFTVEEFYTWTNDLGGRFLPCLETTLEVLGPGHLITTSRPPPGQPLSRMLNVYSIGALRVHPTALGLPPAGVHFEERAGLAFYEIRCETNRPRLGWARRLFGVGPRQYQLARELRTARTELLDRDRVLDETTEGLAAAQAEAEASQERYRAIFDAATDGILVLDRQNVVIDANSAAAQLFARPLDELLGLRVEDLVGSDHREAVAKSAALLRAKGHAELELEALRPDGSTFIISGRLSELGSSSSLAIIRDVTETRALQAALREKKKLESLGVMAGGVAHDFNNLLTVILGGAAVIEAEMGGGASEGIGESLEAINIAASQSAKLVGQMLDYAGGRPIRRETVGCRDIFHDVTVLAEPAVRRSNSDLKVAVDDTLSLVVDISRVRQVLVNLVTNAAEALEGRGGTIRLDGRAAGAGDPHASVALTVSDDGPGMSADVLERLYDPFFTTKATGRGLGLSAVRGIVAAHDGTIEVDSKPGVGTVFTILLPCEQGATARAAEASAGLVGRGRVALVAEDNPRVRKATMRLLEQRGFRVRGAADRDAMLASLDETLELLIMDVVMPGLSCSEALERLERDYPALPVVVMSGYADQRLELGPRFVFLQKPFRFSQLQDAIERAMSRADPPEEDVEK